MNRQKDISHQEGSALFAMVTLPSVFLLEPSLSIYRAGTSAYLVKAGGGLLFLVLAGWVLVMYCRRAERLGGRISFLRFMEDVLGRWGARTAAFGWLLLLTAHLAVTLRMVAESTAKTALMQSELLFPLVLFGGAMVPAARYRLTALLRASCILLAVSAGAVVLLAALLLPMWEVSFLLPWQGFGYGHTAREVGLDMGTWCAGSVLLLLLPRIRDAESGRRSLTYGVGSVMVLKCGILLSALCVFGSVVGGERSLLFYEMAKLVHFSQYIQRVEAVFLCVQMMVVFLGMTLLVRMSVHLASELLAIDDARPLVPLYISLVSLASALVRDLAFAAEGTAVLGYTLAPMLLVGVVGALSVGYFRRERRERDAMRVGSRT